MAQWDETADFVIVGSGGGSMCAAIACVDMGMKPLILEKMELVGGSTAMSGGILWIPANSFMKAAGVEDSVEDGLRYLNHLVPDQPGSTPQRKRAYVETGREMVDWLATKGIKWVYCRGWSDYYDERPGGRPDGRSLGMALFDRNKLGPWNEKLRGNFFPIPVQGTEGHKLALFARTLTGFLIGTRVAFRIVKKRIFGIAYASNGAAIQGRMLEVALKHNVDIRLKHGVKDFVVEDGRVTGVIVDANGVEKCIGGTRGVLINAGGFAHNAEMRAKYGPQPSSTEWTVSNPGDTGEMIERAMDLGIAVHGLDRAIWCVYSRQPSGRPGMHANELAKPHLIVVNKNGKRITDESGSYMETGQNIYRAGAVPCFAIMDSRHRASYNWALTPPRYTPSDWLSSGYMKKANSLRELAGLAGIDADGLEAEVARFNGFVDNGRDEDFHRGERAYDRYFGDPSHTPSPTLGKLSKPPYYAVTLYPGDVGTYGGIVTDEWGRAIREDGSILPGLYATGNSTASVTGDKYPGAGASIGASFIFAYRAAKHACGANN